MAPPRAGLSFSMVCIVQSHAWLFAPPLDVVRVHHRVDARSGIKASLSRDSVQRVSPLHMSAEQTSEQNAMMDRLSPESIDTIVGFVNRMPEDVIAYTMGFSELGEIARKKNAFTAGSFVMESAKITALDGEGMDVVAKIRERSFFGKVETSERQARVAFPGRREKPLDTSSGVKRCLMSMSREMGRVSSTGDLYKIPVGSYSGLPLNMKLNNVPHSRLARNFIYQGAADATVAAVQDPTVPRRMKLTCVVPELNPEMDTYRVGTMLEMVREVSSCLADLGLRVKICIQGNMGEPGFTGMPLNLSGMAAIMRGMGWPDGMEGEKIFFGEVGEDEVQAEDDVFIIISPQSMVGATIHVPLSRMVNAAAGRPFLLVNPSLRDRPSSGGLMSVRGREERMAFADSFKDVFNYRLVYPSSASYYPIRGAVMKSGPRELYVVFERVDNEKGEEYTPLATFEQDPDGRDISPLFGM